jgi:hypothetical protein
MTGFIAGLTLGIIAGGFAYRDWTWFRAVPFQQTCEICGTGHAQKQQAEFCLKYQSGL